MCEKAQKENKASQPVKIKVKTLESQCTTMANI